MDIAAYMIRRTPSGYLELRCPTCDEAIVVSEEYWPYTVGVLQELAHRHEYKSHTEQLPRQFGKH